MKVTNRETQSVFFLVKGRYYEPVWYMCLKTENCCLKTFMKTRVGEKVC